MGYMLEIVMFLKIDVQFLMLSHYLDDFVLPYCQLMIYSSLLL